MIRIDCFHSTYQMTCSSFSSAEESDLILYLALERITFNQVSNFITESLKNTTTAQL